MTDATITTVKNHASKLRYTVSDMGAALALAEQLRLVRVGMSVAHPVLSEKEERPYSDDLEPLAEQVKADVGIGMATKGATARAYSPEEVAVLFGLFHVAAHQEDIVASFLLISQRTESAVTARVRTMIKQIEKIPPPKK